MGRSRFSVVIVLVVSLLMAGFTRHWAAAQRTRGNGATPRAASATGLSQMNSYALALLLGGLRGPLVMILWPSAEQQKNEKNLEDFDTKIEWIRLLQAEFDTVHIFQIWNKAYNISAQMASLSNKYRTIIDALDYAHSVDREKPNNINIAGAIANVYFYKYGTSTEKEYYRPRVRNESMARQELVRITLPKTRMEEVRKLALKAGMSQAQLQFTQVQPETAVAVTLPKTIALSIQPNFSGEGITFADRPRIQTNRDDPTWRRTELGPMLDEQGNILPEYLTVKSPRPANLPPDKGWNDGSELQYLKSHQPYKYGISPIALAYNYYKRAEVLQETNKQKHAQLSDLSVDSYPAIVMKNWSEEEWERGRASELEAFDKTIPSARLSMELMTGAISLDTPIAYPSRIAEALDGYDLAARLTQDALAEYTRHLERYKFKLGTYLPHMDDLRAEDQLVRGDAAFLRAMLERNKPELKTSATAFYTEALRRYQMIVLQYWVPDQLVPSLYPADTTKANIAQKNLPPEAIAELFNRARDILRPVLKNVDSGDIIDEYFHYIAHAEARLQTLK